MKNVPKRTTIDLQDINHLIDIIIDYANENEKDYLLARIKGIARQIKTITKKYNK